MKLPFLTPRPSPDAWISRLAFMTRPCCVALLAIMAVPSAHGQPPSDRREPAAEPAIPAILAAFDAHDLVGMPAAHGLKDLDDLIFTLVAIQPSRKK